MSRADPRGPYDTPSDVHAEEGEVVILGPDGVGVSMTPDAADETSRRLADRARTARNQGGKDGLDGDGLGHGGGAETFAHPPRLAAARPPHDEGGKGN